jgi:hypothetical protein
MGACRRCRCATCKTTCCPGGMAWVLIPMELAEGGDLMADMAPGVPQQPGQGTPQGAWAQLTMVGLTVCLRCVLCVLCVLEAVCAVCAVCAV